MGYASAISELTEIQNQQELLNADSNIDAQIVVWNYNAMIDLDFDIQNETQPVCGPAGLYDVPFGMWDEMWADTSSGFYLHPLQVSVWDTFDAVLLSPVGQMLGVLPVWNASDASQIYDFILDNVK